MSRYPFEEFSTQFMASMVGVYSDVHWTTLQRRYRRMSLDIRRLHDEGRISSTSPKKMTAEDIRVHLVYRKGLGYSAKEYAHEVNALIILFDFCENMAVRSCLRKYPLLRPMADHHRLPVISDGERSRILRGCSAFSGSDDFDMVRSYAMLAILLGCGLRTKELRLCDAMDLDPSSWMLEVIHVKGEDRWGEPRTVPVPPVFRPIISRYLGLRDPSKVALFYPTRGNSDYLSSNSIRKILSKSLSDSKVSANPQELRRSFGQGYLDSDIDSIESVSVLMGHASTNTTERYYARRRNSRAIEAAMRTWDVPGNANPFGIGSVPNDSQTCENEEDGAGNGT